MFQLFWLFFWAVLSSLVVAAGWKANARSRALLGGGRPRLDDDAIRAIVATGELHVDSAEGEDDDPLDLREIEQEEERFWSETWDEPEEI